MEKLVQQIGSYELVSWTQSDAVHYGIREKQKSNFISKYSPTAELKGWDLRKFVVEELQRLATAKKVPEVVRLPDEWFPSDYTGDRTMSIPVVCWNPPKAISSRCDICQYAFMCRVPLKKYPKGNV